MTKVYKTKNSMTNSEIAERLADIQFDTFEHFEVDHLPQDADTLNDMVEWTADQLRKTSWYSLISKEAVLEADEEYNAHLIASVAACELGYDDIEGMEEDE